MVSNSRLVGGFGRRIFNMTEIKKQEEEVTEENREEDVMKDVPDYERSTNKRSELQNFVKDFNSLVINEKSASKSKGLKT